MKPVPGRNVDGSNWWVLPALYDADAQAPLAEIGPRQSDVFSALHGGIAQFNCAVYWQHIKDIDASAFVADIKELKLPRITPILSVDPNLDTAGFAEWIAKNVDLIRELMPPVCKLYSMDPNFWQNLEAVASAGLLPIMYLDDDVVPQVVERVDYPVHFRHAYSLELVELMGSVKGATLQTSPHFLLPLLPDQRTNLWVLPPVPPDSTRQALVGAVPQRVDILVTDHNAPPFGDRLGPGLRLQQDFLSSLLTACDLFAWSLADTWKKVTENPKNLFQVELGETFAIVDPWARRRSGLWYGQGPERAPFLGTTLHGNVLAVGCEDRAAVV
jgi:hypothetical protein